jgi:hypothetical protein
MADVDADADADAEALATWTGAATAGELVTTRGLVTAVGSRVPTAAAAAAADGTGAPGFFLAYGFTITIITTWNERWVVLGCDVM